ncbi:hypothetical protein [Lactiplantibacillus daowaiensis]|uniref:Uncharacterized protein n=1 Tax=Lactiplantibacillus daowaiensis TaxID=2559918 RepID=A0ABW1RYP3_9LACO|nr:hypothetical protein [Lactiplantibacillus daowaiensis]
MYEIPQDLVAAQAVATKRQLPLNDAIRLGLQNWIQELLAEGFEGNYYTAKLQSDQLVILDITGNVALTTTTLTGDQGVAQFKADAHEALLTVQN